MGMQLRAVIFQYRLLHYRVKFFERLREKCAERGIKIDVVSGQASRRELAKRDEGELSWAVRVKNFFWEFYSRDIVWQPIPKQIRAADLFIVMQESRIISNYWLLMSRLWSRRKMAYWGHGRNFQSDAPSGMRERWKSFLLTRVDWWFAYTQMTVDILREAGYPVERITSLENAIDTDGFKIDLASWSVEQIAEARSALGIPPDASIGIFCGSLYPDKRLELLIESADWIKQRQPNLHVVVIGDGPSMPLMREAASTRPWIHLLGVKTGREKALYFRMGDVMLNPGLVGLHIVDAFCSGLVMITTRTARHSPEVAYLRDGENGVMADDTPEGYGRAVLDVIGSPEVLARMKAAALADSERYTLDNMVDRFVDGIESALKAR